jgi:hypothetical protein
MTNIFTASTIIRPDPRLIVSPLDNEVVMMSIERGNYYGLNPVAADIWRIIGKGVSIGGICDQLATEYEVTPEECTSEVMAFISKLLEERLVEIQMDVDS